MVFAWKYMFVDVQLRMTCFFWHCWHSMLSGVYEMVKHLSFCLSVPSFNRSLCVQPLCCWALCGQDISTDTAANASSVTLTAVVGSWTHRLVVNVLASDEGQVYYPIFFTHDHAFEEFYCICIQLVNKTWKEMKATSIDFTKVTSVVCLTSQLLMWYLSLLNSNLTGLPR